MAKNMAYCAFALVHRMKKLDGDINTLEELLDVLKDIDGNIPAMIGWDLSDQNSCAYVPLSAENIKQLLESKRSELEVVRDELEAL